MQPALMANLAAIAVRAFDVLVVTLIFTVLT
jgi:hypothetical protein